MATKAVSPKRSVRRETSTRCRSCHESMRRHSWGSENTYSVLRRVRTTVQGKASEYQAGTAVPPTPPRPAASPRTTTHLIVEQHNVDDAEPLAGIEVDLVPLVDHLSVGRLSEIVPVRGRLDQRPWSPGLSRPSSTSRRILSWRVFPFAPEGGNQFSRTLARNVLAAQNGPPRGSGCTCFQYTPSASGSSPGVSSTWKWNSPSRAHAFSDVSRQAERPSPIRVRSSTLSK